MDVRCQKAIEKILRLAAPGVPVLGEEGVIGDVQAGHRWVVDPIDGTVNFAYGIPHCAVSIALQAKVQGSKLKIKNSAEDYETLVGAVYDPFCDELWTAVRGKAALLNGKKIQVGSRNKLEESIVAIGFAKSAANLEHGLPYFNWLARRVRKVRMMGSAALALTYVASGRFDAYVETGLRLWDIAAGGLNVECAGGEFWREAMPGEYTYQLIANNGVLRKKLQPSSLS